MTLNGYQRDKIVNALVEYRKIHADITDHHFCRQFDINPAAFSRLKKGEREKIVASDKLVSIGRKLGVHFTDMVPWEVVQTDVYQYITGQLEYCQKNRESRIFCDKADLGKTTAARSYMLANQNVYYIDCSQVKTRTLFLRKLAKTVGVNSQGSISTVIADIVYMMQAVDKPIVILDEAGDLQYEAFLEIKALWNALEGYCGWYMMGADGLKAKIEANIRGKKVGYAEIFRRFSSNFMTIVPSSNPVDEKMFLRRQAEAVAHGNMPKGTDVKELLKNSISLTRVKSNIQKIIRQGEAV